MNNVNQELIAVAKTAFETSLKRTFTNLVGVAPTQIFLIWFNSLFDVYGQPNPDDITANNQRMVAEWNPATRDFASVIRQIEDATIFAVFLGQPKQDHESIYAGELVIHNAGFRQAPDVVQEDPGRTQRTWANFKIFFSEEIAAWYRAGCTTGSQAGYGGNAKTFDESSYAEAEQQYMESPRNFSETNANNAKAFDTMANGMMAAINEIKGQLQGLQANAAQAKPPTSTYAPPPAAPAAPVYQQAPPAPSVPTSPSTGRRGGGRGRGRGRGCGGGRGGYQGQGRGGYQGQGRGYPAPSQQQPYQQQGGFYANQRPPNNQKYYANWNYCWTHRYDVADNHHNGNCQRPAYGHVYTATRDNPCGGCQKGASHHFLLKDAPTKAKTAEHNRKEVKLPDGTIINSSHKCELDLNDIPKEASDGYIIPDMINHSLLSVTHLCKAGCQVQFTGNTCIVTYKGKENMRRQRSKINGLWLVPLTDKVTRRHSIALTYDATNSAYHTSRTLAETIQFLHQ
eukprot:scaffold72809_cov82-Cyclotella_meneghiniana.AAC.1